MLSFLVDTFSRFLAHDLQVSGGNATKMWAPLLYPCLRSVPDLATQLSYICQRAFANRLQGSKPLRHFVEYWCGTANVTKEMIKAGFEGAGFDIIHSHMHSCLDICGLRLWMDMLMSICGHGLCWLGPPCSSFFVLCLVQSQRYDWNQWWGDTTRTFVRTGNSHVQVAAIMFLVSCVTGIMVFLEQPDNSCLHKCPPRRSVLSIVKALHVKTYLGAFSGPMQAIADMDQQSVFLSTGQRLPNQGTIVRWATGHSKWRWPEFRWEEGPARGVRYLHSTIWVKCCPDFCIGVSAATPCVSDFCLTLVPAACMQCVAHNAWGTSVSTIFGNCCKLDFQHMSSSMCLISS